MQEEVKEEDARRSGDARHRTRLSRRHGRGMILRPIDGCNKATRRPVSAYEVVGANPWLVGRCPPGPAGQGPFVAAARAALRVPGAGRRPTRSCTRVGIDRQLRAAARSRSARTRPTFASITAKTCSIVTGFDAGIVFDAGVVVGDERDAGVVHAELAREVRLGILRHADDVPTLRAVPARLRARREARAVDHDDRARRRARSRRRASRRRPRAPGRPGSTDRRTTRDARGRRRRTCRRGRACDRRAGRARRSRPARRRVAANRPRTVRRRCARRAMRIAQRFARCGMRAGEIVCRGPCRGRNATRRSPTVPIGDGRARRAVGRVDRDRLDVVEEACRSRSRRRPRSSAVRPRATRTWRRTTSRSPTIPTSPRSSTTPRSPSSESTARGVATWCSTLLESPLFESEAAAALLASRCGCRSCRSRSPSARCPAGESTLASLPPQSACFVSGVSENDWYTSRSWPHLAQRYSYVGIAGTPRGGSRWHSRPGECQSYSIGPAARRGAEWGRHGRRAPRSPRLAPRHVPERARSSPGRKGRDILTEGSGNPGASNVGRLLGLALRPARAASWTSPRARSRPGSASPSAVGPARSCSASRRSSATRSRSTARAARASPRGAGMLVVLFPLIVVGPRGRLVRRRAGAARRRRSRRCS